MGEPLLGGMGGEPGCWEMKCVGKGLCWIRRGDLPAGLVMGVHLYSGHPKMLAFGQHNGNQMGEIQPPSVVISCTNEGFCGQPLYG